MILQNERLKSPKGFFSFVRYASGSQLKLWYTEHPLLIKIQAVIDLTNIFHHVSNSLIGYIFAVKSLLIVNMKNIRLQYYPM